MYLLSEAFRDCERKVVSAWMKVVFLDTVIKLQVLPFPVRWQQVEKKEQRRITHG